jgi:hypothetical protein
LFDFLLQYTKVNGFGDIIIHPRLKGIHTNIGHIGSVTELAQMDLGNFLVDRIVFALMSIPKGL